MSNIFQPSFLPNNIDLLIETFIRFYNVSCLNVLNALDIIRIVREIESSGTNKKDGFDKFEFKPIPHDLQNYCYEEYIKQCMIMT